jgi:hypothetical protein
MKIFTKLSAVSFLLITTLSAALANPTILEKGDILVLAVNADNGLVSGISGEDELSFVCFKDITNGTVFEITDNGWERQNAHQWGDNEGTIRITRTGADIPAGTVITFRFAFGNYSAVSPDNSWQFADLNGGNSFDINNGGDQIFFLQGGAWTNSSGMNNASYNNGKVIHSFSTASGWVADGSSNQSNLYPGTDCFSFSGAASDFLKYTGSLSPATQKEWIERVNNSLNWEAFAGSTEFAASAINYTAGQTIAQIPGNTVSGKWTGGRSRDWFDCANWDDFSVPTQNTDIFINSNVLNTVEISSGTAVCGNIEIDGGTLIMRGLAALNVSGNLSISSNGSFSMEENQLSLSGNLLNYAASNFNTGNSTIHINGPDHVIGGGNETEFYNLVLNGGKTSLYNNIKILNNLHIQNASLSLNTMTLFIENPMSNAITTAQNGRIISETFPGSYGVVDWNIGHRIGNYTLPFGTNETVSADMTFKYNINTLGSGAMMDRVQFITYPTNAQNYPLPDGVNQLTNAAGKEVYHRAVDRFWVIENNIENMAFNTYPQIEYVFKYNDADLTSVENTIEKDRLIVRAYNEDTHEWTDWLTSPAFSQPTTNTISVVLGTIDDYNGIWTLMDDSNPLPIELLAFSAACQNDRTEIQWTTASETNNNFFTIERSVDASSFEILKTIPGSSNSNYIISYTTTDDKPLEGTSYYRLKQTDYDGSSKYSNIISVSCGGTEDELTISLANTNSQGNVFIAVNTPNGGNYNINIIDATGKIIFSDVVNWGKGMNTAEIDLNLSAGIYFISIGNEFNTVNRKFLMK